MPSCDVVQRPMNGTRSCATWRQQRLGGRKQSVTLVLRPCREISWREDHRRKRQLDTSYRRSWQGARLLRHDGYSIGQLGATGPGTIPQISLPLPEVAADLAIREGLSDPVEKAGLAVF